MSAREIGVWGMERPSETCNDGGEFQAAWTAAQSKTQEIKSD